MRPWPSVAELVIGEQVLDAFNPGGLVKHLDQVPVEFGALHLQPELGHDLGMSDLVVR
jgi:hypothetical protein